MSPRRPRPSRPKSSAPAKSDGGELGLIVSHRGVAVEVELDSGERSLVRVKRRSGHVVGDRVRVADERLTRLERHNELRRRSPGGGVHVVTVNLDLLLVVIAPEPLPRTGLVDRALVAARAADIRPALLVNKIDLDSGPAVLERMRGMYQGSVEVLGVSAATSEGIDAVRALIAGAGRCALSGHSGVGKSTITNQLVPHAQLETSELSTSSGKGRHTTTVSTLHRLPEGGELVDTPGIKEYGLVDVSADELAHHFPGFEGVLEEPCRFRDCLHRSEPGCHIRAAVEAGEIPEARFDSYTLLLEEVEEQARAEQP
jgi:ribosome biogenesis GTPase